MLEHVGRQNLNHFMAAIDRHLTEDSVAVTRSIGRNARSDFRALAE